MRGTPAEPHSIPHQVRHSFPTTRVTDDLSLRPRLEHYERIFQQLFSLDTGKHGQLGTQQMFSRNLISQRRKQQRDTPIRLREALMECSTNLMKHHLEFSLRGFLQNQLVRSQESSAQIVPAQLTRKLFLLRWTRCSQPKPHSHSAEALHKTERIDLRMKSRL